MERVQEIPKIKGIVRAILVMAAGRAISRRP
jgi:hypothetical protein